MKKQTETLYTIEKDRSDRLITIALSLTVFPWITMLSLGALGHRLDVPFLYRFGFLETILVIFAAYPLRGPGSVKKIVKRASNE